MSRNSKLFSAIDIGSHELKMKIVEIDGNNEVRELETVNKLIPLGRDTFNMGRVSFDSVRKACDALVNFKRLMNDYNVKSYNVYATSAIREAANRDYIVNQLELSTGFDISVINNSLEKFLTYKAIKNNVFNNCNFDINKNTLILDIGAGNIQVSVCENNLLVSSESIKLGSLRIREVLSSLEKRTLNFTRVIEEFIEAHIESLDYFKSQTKIDNFIVVGGSLKYICGLCGSKGNQNKKTIISKPVFEKVYDSMIYESTQSLVEQYNIPYGNADVLVPSLILIRKFLDKTGVEELIISDAS